MSDLNMQEPPAWRALLGQLIHDPQERQRIATELGVNPATLVRWTHNETTPRLQNLQQLLKVVSQQHRQRLRELIAVEFPEFSITESNDAPDNMSFEIPSGTYASVLRTYVTVPKWQRFWLVSNLILQEALGQLDPQELGMTVSLAQFVPPKEGKKVRSLREYVGRGTHPWKATNKLEVAYLGMESLSGYALVNGHLLTIQSRHESETNLPARWLDWEESAVVCPIMLEGCFAGCFIASSTQPAYFTQKREELIQNYADLMVLAFEPHEFYEPHDIQLGMMPEFEIQEKYFSTIRQRVSKTMEEGLKRRPPMTIAEAEQLVWQQLEEEFLQLAHDRTQ